MPAGRPTDYDPAFCERVIRRGKEGFGIAELASDLGVTRQTLKNWMAAHPEFLAAVQRAQDESLAWWEKQPRTNLHNREFNGSVWSKCMSGRFPAEPYRERVQLTGKDDGPIQHVDLSNLSDEELDRLEAVLGPLVGVGEGGEGEASD